MNVNDVKQLKEYYEAQLQTKLSELLSLTKESVDVNWSLEKTTIAIGMSSNNMVTNYFFEYDGTNFIIHSSAHQIIIKNNIPVGIITSTATIDLNTIHAIFDTVVEVINSAINEDNCDAAESSEG